MHYTTKPSIVKLSITHFTHDQIMKIVEHGISYTPIVGPSLIIGGIP
jgi:hypothetical protein